MAIFKTAQKHTLQVASDMHISPKCYVGDVSIFSICDLMADTDLNDSYSIVTMRLQALRNLYPISYYASPKENFCYTDAALLAEKEGNSMVIVEDLS